MELTDDIKSKLQAPFPEKEIEWRVGSTTADKTKGMALAYVTNRAIQTRLDEVFGVFGWQNEFKPWAGNSQLCGISVKSESGEWITKWDGAENTDFEATKGGLSDSMKRAAYQWGIGRYLYNLDAVWVPIKQVGKSYVVETAPKLPAWALPESERGKAPKDTPKPPEPPKEPPTVDISKPRVTEKQADELRKMAKNKWVDKAETLFIRYTGCAKPALVPADMFEAVKKKIQEAPYVEVSK